jgi:hypothetical protein
MFVEFVLVATTAHLEYVGHPALAGQASVA